MVKPKLVSVVTPMRLDKVWPNSAMYIPVDPKDNCIPFVYICKESLEKLGILPISFIEISLTSIVKEDAE